MVGHFLKRSDGKKFQNAPKKQREQLLLEEWDNDRSNINVQSTPNLFMITSTEQNRKLQMKIIEVSEDVLSPNIELSVNNVEAAHALEQTSEEWLSQHGLESEKLTLKDLFDKGTPLGASTIGDYDDEDVNCFKHLKMIENDVKEFEVNLHSFIGKLQHRIQWLLNDSRKVFGLVKGLNPCLLVDASDINMCLGRASYLRESLKQLLEEQLVQKSKVQLMSFNQTVRCAWGQPKPINDFLKREAMKWMDCLTPSSGCSVIEAFKASFRQKPVDSIVLILGSCPDQNPQLIIDYVKEQVSGRKIFLHTVCFNCRLLETQQFLQDLAEECDGRYHCFSTEKEDDAMLSTDVVLLTEEMQKAYGVLVQLKELKEGGIVENKTITYKKLHQESVEINPYESEEMKRYLKEYQQIDIESAYSQIRSSSQWLKTHGLKAKGLSLYQVMAPNAYSYVNSYVSSLNKQVTSRIHHQSMVQMDWYDGSVKNVHVDPIILFNYQHHLQTAIFAYERRVQWLQQNSRKCFGTIVHDRVLLLVDLSTDTQFGLGELQLSMKCLLEQQLSGKESFNIVCIGEEIHTFNQTMVKPTKGNITAAWRWFSQLTCRGARKCLKSFRQIFEKNESEEHDVHDMDGIYLIVTGPPDEHEDVLNAYLCEQLCGTDISVNCILFQSVTQNEFDAGPYLDVEATSQYLQTIAHQNNGRFHWIDSQMIVESDDIRLIHNEMNKANNYLHKSQLLFKKLRAKRGDSVKPGNKIQTEEKKKRKTITRPTSGKNTDIKSPKHTALSLARLGRSRPQTASLATPTTTVLCKQNSPSEKKKPVSVKLQCTNSSTPWRPSTAYARSLIPTVPDPVPGRTFQQDISERVAHERDGPVKQVFYTEVGNTTGSVFRETRSFHRQPLTSAVAALETKKSSIPKHEELLSTKDWLHKYGLSNINARLFSLSPNKVNKAIHQPNVSLKELKSYEEQIEKIMRRCTKRMKWLLKGSHLVFGTVLEEHVVLLIDTSGSMVHHMKQLKEQLVHVVWEQLYKYKKFFNLIGYSNNVTCWRNELVEATKGNCEEAIVWLYSLRCDGSTATLDALQHAFDFDDVMGVYLLSDGKPDSSTTMVLREATNMNTNRDVHIHAISFNCNDGEANTFLKMLAWQSNGRFHMFKTKSNSDDEIDVVQHEIFAVHDEDEHAQNQRATPPHSMTLFEGDDLKLLLKEIDSAKTFFQQVKSCVSAFEESSRRKKKNVSSSEHHLKPEEATS